MWGYAKPYSISTMHMGECGVCGEHKSVTEARDYGYMVPGWQKKRAG
jgi:hypothetical protein